jgi:hypothetical protein
MPNWDEDSSELRQNLARIQQQLPQEGRKREIPTRRDARELETYRPGFS